MRRSSSSFSSSATAASARSMSVSTSPIPRMRDAISDGLDRIGALVRVDGDPDLFAELDELVDRGRSLEVGCDEGGLLPVLLQQESEFPGGGRLARALEAREEDRGRRPGREREL